jgi:hypothetical protein
MYGLFLSLVGNMYTFICREYGLNIGFFCIGLCLLINLKIIEIYYRMHN